MQHGLLVSTQDPPDGARIVERWRELLALAPLAEQCGFASFHVPEHHGLDDGYMPQPLVACAALAARTRTIGIGTALTVAPLRHPLHLAEEAAVVDVLSEGRLLLAVGIGNYRPEFDLFGVPFDEQGTRLDECLQILTLGLGGERFDHEGTHYTLRQAAIRPRPVQRPRPPIWLGAMSRRGVERAAAFGLPLLLDPISTISQLESLVTHYRDECARHGSEPEVILMRWGFVDGAHDAAEAWWPHVRGALWSYIVDIPRLAASTVSVTARSPEELDLREVAPERLLVGDAGELRALLAEWTERLGATRVIVKFQGASGPWGDTLRTTVEQYGRDVIAHGS